MRGPISLRFFAVALLPFRRQREAALALGLIKDTSLAYIVGLQELTREAKLIADFTFRPLEIYVVIALVYFGLCFPLSRLVPVVERRMQRMGTVHGRLSV